MSNSFSLPMSIPDGRLHESVGSLSQSPPASPLSTLPMGIPQHVSTGNHPLSPTTALSDCQWELCPHFRVDHQCSQDNPGSHLSVPTSIPSYLLARNSSLRWAAFPALLSSPTGNTSLSPTLALHLAPPRRHSYWCSCILQHHIEWQRSFLI